MKRTLVAAAMLLTIVSAFAKSSLVSVNDQRDDSKMEARKNAEIVVPGADYLDIAGPDAITGKKISISKILKKGKPVIIDFWASWCPPCRREIKDKLVDLAKKGEVNIIGIAVWEKDLEDTRAAMKELGVSWPVIYTGGRTDSPSIKYGVLAIPTMFLVNTDGKIVSSGHRVEDLF